MKEYKGIKPVFRFTANQYLKKNGFARITIIFTIILFLAAGAVIFFTGQPKKEKEKKPSETKQIGTVEVLNMTDLKDVLPKKAKDEEEEESAWSFISVQGDEDTAFASVAKSKDRLLAIVETKTEDGKLQYVTRVLIPKDSDISQGQAFDAGEMISSSVKDAVYKSVNMTDAMISFIALEPISRSITVDDDVSMLNSLIKGILPALLGIVMYMMILLHGQTISKEVAAEKTSKLMETMLITVTPNALILGKTLAITALAIGQFFAWIAGIVLGLFGGDILGKAVYGDRFINRLKMVLDYLRTFIGESALSPAAIVMAVIAFCFGIFIFFALAAMGGSFVSKPEEAASANSVFIFPLIVSWVIPYMASITENEATLRICRYVPFTAPFCVPVDILTGNVGLLGGVITCLLITAVALLLIWLAARIYRGMVFHTGQKISLKNILNVLLGK